MPVFLLCTELLICIFCFIKLWKHDKFIGAFFAALYLYSTPALIGYFFVPELSRATKAYFGLEVGYKAFWFTLASMLMFYAVAIFLSKIRVKKSFLKITKSHSVRNVHVYIALAVLVMMNLVQVLNCIINKDLMTYFVVSDSSKTDGNALLSLGLFLLKASVGCNLVLYTSIRAKMFTKKVRRHVLLVFLFSMIVFVYSVFSVGNRTDVVAFVLGVICVEVELGFVNRKNIFKYVLLGVGAVAFMMGIAIVRDKNFLLGRTGFVRSILAQDYYYPAHIMFAAINFDVVDPIEVIKSNFCNSLILMDYPYLQMGVTDLFNPGIATRSQGYAFFPFAEGYMFMGKLGFLYNGIVLNLGIRLWKRIANSNDKGFNIVCRTVLWTFIINLMRGQSSYYIKYLYTNVIFSIILYAVFFGKSIRPVFYKYHKHG